MQEKFKKVGGGGVGSVEKQHESTPKQSYKTRKQQEFVKKTLNAEAMSIAKQRVKSKFFAVFLCFLFVCFASIFSLSLLQNTNKNIIVAQGGSLVQDTDGYYMIDDYADLCAFRDLVNGGDDCYTKGFKLTADIQIPGGETWTPIGSSNNNCFSGVFDGRGHRLIFGDLSTPVKISGSYGGLFFYVSSATLINVGIVGRVTLLNDIAYHGALVAYLTHFSIVSNCYSVMTLLVQTNKSCYIGGVVGCSIDSKIFNCFNMAYVSVFKSGSNSSYIGGIVGRFERGVLSNCYNTGDVDCTYSTSNVRMGGIAGSVITSTIENCYNTGAVSSKLAWESTVGGICGECGSSGVTITNCYNTGKIEARADGSGGICARAGGIVGTSGGEVKNCYNIGEILSVTTGDSSKCQIGLIHGIPNNATASDSAALSINQSLPLTLSGSDLVIGDTTYIFGQKIPKATATDQKAYLNNTQTEVTDATIVNFLKALWNTSEGVNSMNTSYFSNTKIWDDTCAWDFVNSWEIVGADYPSLKNNLKSVDVLPQALEIGSLDELLDATQSIAEDSDGLRYVTSFKLVADIEIPGGTEWNPILFSSSGSLDVLPPAVDGNGHKVIFGSEENPVIMQSYYGYFSGFFAMSGEVKNLGIAGAMVFKDGGICGSIAGICLGEISNCYNSATIISNAAQSIIGGIVGGVMSTGIDTLITNCFNTGRIVSTSSAAGIVAMTQAEDAAIKITNCYNTGNIEVISSSTGGAGGIMVEHAGGSLTLSNCFNVGEIVSVTTDSSNMASCKAGGIYAAGVTPVDCAYLNGAIVEVNGESLEVQGTTYTVYGYKLPKATTGIETIYLNDGTTETTDENITSFLHALWKTSNGIKALTSNHFKSDIWLSTQEGGTSWNFTNLWGINSETGQQEFFDSSVAKYALNMQIAKKLSSDALLMITSEDQVFTMYLNAGQNSLSCAISQLSTGKEYVIRVYNGTLSGTLSGSDVIINQSSYYSFICNTVDATINLSGLTITN